MENFYIVYTREPTPESCLEKDNWIFLLSGFFFHPLYIVKGVHKITLDTFFVYNNFE